MTTKAIAIGIHKIENISCDIPTVPLKFLKLGDSETIGGFTIYRHGMNSAPPDHKRLHVKLPFEQDAYQYSVYSQDGLELGRVRLNEVFGFLRVKGVDIPPTKYQNYRDEIKSPTAKRLRIEFVEYQTLTAIGDWPGSTQKDLVDILNDNFVLYVDQSGTVEEMYQQKLVRILKTLIDKGKVRYEFNESGAKIYYKN